MAIEAADHKETKAQRAERLKREKNPWQSLAELKEYARRGFDAIPPEWIGTYLRWWGVYTQGDGAGVVGGTGGEGKATPFFMLRIRIPNGFVTSPQLREIARLAEKYARGTADLTVRQNIQLHWVTAESLPEVLESLEHAGLTSLGACGDVTRNVTGCPIAGIDANEICDASPLVREVNDLLAGNSEFYNLPRKFKVSISGCPQWCSYPEINDVGLTAVRRGDEVGFSLRVGGGLSTQPHLAVRLNVFVRWEQVVRTVEAIASMFRDQEVLRHNRKRARLKYLFLEHDWNAERFQQELERRLGFSFDPAEPELLPSDAYRDHNGIQRQNTPGLVSIGASVLRGRITPEQLWHVANLADCYGNGEIRTTGTQNVILPNIREEAATTVVDALSRSGLPVRTSVFRRGAVACTGAEFCKLALTETKSFTRWLVEEMEERLPEFDDALRIHVTGCPNSCGQHWLADLGIEGKKIKVGEQMIDAYYFCVGGGVGSEAAIARPIGFRCPANEVPDAIERLVQGYLRRRRTGETLRHFLARTSTDELRTIAAGEVLAPVERDLPSGHVPSELAG